MKFILTKELGRFTRWLRLLGYDCVYFDSDDSQKLFITAFNEKRVIITKRRKISTSKTVRVICIKSDLLKDQLAELKKSLKKKLGKTTLFTRCSECNKVLFKIEKKSVRSSVPEYVFKTQKNFLQCPGCAKIFWKATHFDRAREFMESMVIGNR